jgi:predicted membrane protein
MSNERFSFNQHFNRHRGSVTARLAIGIAIIALGAVYMADNIGIIDVEHPMRFFWPAAFLAIGTTVLIERKSVNSQFWAYGWLLVGAIEFAYQAYWIPFGISKLIFPIFLLLIGARLVQRAMNTNTDGGAQTENGPAAQNRIFAMLSGSERRSFSEPLRDAEVTSIMSGVKLDLTNTVFEGERATLNVTAIMGGIEVYAPSEWNIVSDVTPILGAYIDKRRPTATPSTKTLIISGTVIMGGVEVKN